MTFFTGSFHRRAGSLLALACLAFVAYRLVGHLQSLPPVRWTGGAIGSLLVSSFIVVGIEAVHSLSWRTLARAVDPRISWRESYVLCGRSQIAKYLPTNVLHYVQRVILARRGGADIVDASALTAVDAILVLLTGGLIGLPAVGRALRAAGPGVLAARVPVALMVLGAALLIGAGLLIYLPGGGEWVRRIGRLLRPGRLVIAMLVDVVPFVLAGITVHLVLHGFWPGATSLTWIDFVPGFALGFALGFVTPGAPGGLGVREIVLYALYAPVLGGGLAAGLFLLLRVSHVLGDVLTFLTASLIGRNPTEKRTRTNPA